MKRKIALVFFWSIFILMSIEVIGTSIRRDRIYPKVPPYSIYADRYIIERERSFFYYIWKEMSVEIIKEKTEKNCQ